MRFTALFPQWRDLRLTDTRTTGNQLTLTAETTAHKACCPLCHQPSRIVHSHYQRRVADLPCGGRAVTLLIHARRFFCRTSDCPKRTFCEHLPALVAPGARRSHALNAALTRIGVALGGKAGARLAHHLAMPTSDDTLLRLVCHAPLPAMHSPQILGVDDWAWKKGRRYGTILCDLARRQVVDLLPDRSADTVAAWLHVFPNVTVVARDRSDVYADGATRGAPHATQVADRFHLLKNLGDALERSLQHKRTLIAQVLAPSALVFVPSPPGQPWQERQEADSQRRHAPWITRYETVIALHEKGAEVAHIARTTGISRTTVYRYLRLGCPPERKRPRPRHDKAITPYADYLCKRWDEGCHTATRLWREIRAMGYPASYTNVIRFLAPLRLPIGQRPSVYRERRRSDAVPTPRQVAMLFVQHPDRLTPEQRTWRDQLVRADATLATAHMLAQAFATMVRARQGERLTEWIAAAKASDLPELRRFAVGLLPDEAAIVAGLTEEWSNGQTEGQINRLKTLKRQMYDSVGECASPLVA